MKLSFETLDLTLRDPFTISRGTQLHANNVRVTLSDGDLSGTGEAAPSSHYGDSKDSVLALLDLLRDTLSPRECLPISSLHVLMDEVAHLNPAAKAAIDIAAYDLLGRRVGAPIYELLGLDATKTPRTSFTIGIDSPEVMSRKAGEARAYPILKVKVGTPNDRANLEAIRAVRPDAIIRVDANEAWTPKQAIRNIEELSEYDLEFVEQPVTARDLEGLGHVRDSVSIPILADESCVVPDDVVLVAPYVDGINIKLMKCGGIYPALKMIHIARAHHLAAMMGCMIESSIAITAAAHLSPLLDYADLDGNLLVKDDPYHGVSIDSGRLVLASGAGLGIQPAA